MRSRVTGLHSHLDLVISLGSRESRDLSEREKFDMWIIPDALELDFQTAGGRAKFGEVFVELGDTTAKEWCFLDDIDIMPQFRRFYGSSQTRKAATDDENGIGHPDYPPTFGIKRGRPPLEKGGSPPSKPSVYTIQHPG